MKLWPDTSFEMHTTLSPSQVEALLTARTRDSWNFWPLWTDERVFRGWVDRTGFFLVQYAPTANAFRPWMVGDIEPDASGSRVSVRMRLDRISTLVAALWFGVIALQSALAISGSSSILGTGLLGLGWGLGLLFGSYGLLASSFSRLAGRSRTLLEDILDG